MIAPALLEALREKDPATWQRIVRGPPMIPYHKYYTYDIDGSATAHKDERAYIPFDELLPEVACAWLQAVLQDAIQARGWQGIVLFNAESNRAVIDDRVDGMGGTRILAEREGDSPADALLKAYLEAIG